MWTWLASFLSGPIINGAIKAYEKKLASDTDRDKIASELAARELVVQTREIDVQSQLKIAQIGRAWEPEKLFAYIIVIYFAKLVIWDKVIGSFAGYTANIFRTDPLTGEAVGWAAMVMAFYFGKRGIENVARILKR